jgi:hypothetical protein
MHSFKSRASIAICPAIPNIATFLPTDSAEEPNIDMRWIDAESHITREKCAIDNA